MSGPGAPVMRLFVAVELPPDLRAALAVCMSEMAAMWPEAKWVPAVNLHLTVKFIGEWGRQRLASLEAALERAAAMHGPFALMLRGAGYFGSASAPRIVWAGVEDREARLAAVASSVDRVLIGLGVPGETRPFRAHLTLARGRGDAVPAELRQRLGELRAQAWGQLSVDQISLFASTLKPSGPAYERLSAFALSNH